MSRRTSQSGCPLGDWSVVRQLVGYDRYESEEALTHLDRVYALVRGSVNGWLPVMKLVAKERAGAKVRTHDDVPQTPSPARGSPARAGGDPRAGDGVVSDDAQQAVATLRPARGPLAVRRQLDVERERRWALRVGAAGSPLRRPALAATA